MPPSDATRGGGNVGEGVEKIAGDPLLAVLNELKRDMAAPRGTAAGSEILRPM